MKSRNRHNPAFTAIAGWWFSNVVVAAKAFRYGYAAERDERNGFAYAAAMEWRKAAELFPPNTRAAEYLWQQWERIMHLPRRLAGPIGVPSPIAFPLQSPASQPAIAPAIDQISFAHAA